MCSSPATAAWSAWTDPPRWPGGIIENATIDGDFAVGAKVTVKATGGPTTKATITEVDPPRKWVGVSKFPGLTLTSEHLIEPTDAGTVSTERVTMSGVLAAATARLIGRRLETDFAATTSRIARLAEASREH
ncbi:SRPBCC family protein [Mycolicibacterium sp. XJ870]